VAGDQDWKWVFAIGRAHGTDGSRTPDAFCLILIAHGRSIGDSSQGLPAFDLKVGSVQQKLEIKNSTAFLKVLGQLFFYRPGKAKLGLSQWGTLLVFWPYLAQNQDLQPASRVSRGELAQSQS
jgi:hypothetical protein